METAHPHLRPRILEAYVAREFLKLLILSLTAFVSLFVIVDFFEKIDRLVEAHLGLWDLVCYVSLKVPFAAGQVLPAAALLGIMLTFGLMSRSHETMAMRTSGLDILQLLRPVLIVTGGVMAVMLALNLYLIPGARRASTGSGKAAWRRSRPTTCKPWSTSGTRETRQFITFSFTEEIFKPWRGSRSIFSTGNFI